MTTTARDLLEQSFVEASREWWDYYGDKGYEQNVDDLAATPSGATLLDLADRGIAAEAEVERLRTALVDIADRYVSDNNIGPKAYAGWAGESALAALAPKEGMEKGWPAVGGMATPTADDTCRPPEPDHATEHHAELAAAAQGMSADQWQRLTDAVAALPNAVNLPDGMHQGILHPPEPDRTAARSECCCTSPTPDPASPCARCRLPGSSNQHRTVDDCWVKAPGCLTCSEPDMHHPHQPTRCTCGHPIKEATR